MKNLICLIIVCVFSLTANAQLPQRGILMSSVEAEFGSPKSVSPTVGEPPITRWFYDTFTVIFEYEHVIHAFPRNTSVENLSSRNTDGLVLPSESYSNTVNTTETTTSSSNKDEAFSESDPKSAKENAFFNNTPDLIN